MIYYKNIGDYMNKITKFYTISMLPSSVQRRNPHDESLLFLNSTDENTTKVIHTKFGERSYYIYSGEERVFEKYGIDDALYFALSNKGKIREVKKEVSAIDINGKGCLHFKYKGSLFGLEVVKIYFDSEEDALNFKRPTWIKDELKNKFFEKELGKFTNREKE